MKTTQRDQFSLQYVLPSKSQWKALCAFHDGVGHLGSERSMYLLKDRFNWVGMCTDMNEHIQKCDRCLRLKSKPQKEELHPLPTTYSMELVCIDFLTLESGKTDKGINVLVVTDHFTCYAQAYVTPSQMAKVVATLLRDKLFVRYGLQNRSSVIRGVISRAV